MGNITKISSIISKEEVLERLLDKELSFKIEDHCYNESSGDYTIRVIVKEYSSYEDWVHPPHPLRTGFFSSGDAIEILQAIINLETERMI